jgi:hypothetical protein
METPAYAAWFAPVRDRTARARIDIRIRRLSLGNSGDIRPVSLWIAHYRGGVMPSLLPAGSLSAAAKPALLLCSLSHGRLCVNTRGGAPRPLNCYEMSSLDWQFRRIVQD